MITQTELSNNTLKTYSFLSEMFRDPFFPDFLVEKCKSILLDLCKDIENNRPNSLDELYELTHASTERLNDLEEEFGEHESEIETAARECLTLDIEAIAKAYGYNDADLEELVAPREW